MQTCRSINAINCNFILLLLLLLGEYKSKVKIHGQKVTGNRVVAHRHDGEVDEIEIEIETEDQSVNIGVASQNITGIVHTWHYPIGRHVMFDMNLLCRMPINIKIS